MCRCHRLLALFGEAIRVPFAKTCRKPRVGVHDGTAPLAVAQGLRGKAEQKDQAREQVTERLDLLKAWERGFDPIAKGAAALAEKLAAEEAKAEEAEEKGRGGEEKGAAEGGAAEPAAKKRKKK